MVKQKEWNNELNEHLSELIGNNSLSKVLTGVAIWCETGSAYMAKEDDKTYSSVLKKIGKSLRRSEKMMDDYYNNLEV